MGAGDGETVSLIFFADDGARGTTGVIGDAVDCCGAGVAMTEAEVTGEFPLIFAG